MTTPQPAALPELPEPVANVSASNPISGIGFVKPDKPYYTADQMRAYALAALQSQPAAAGVSDAEIDRICYLATEIRFAKTDDAAQAVIDQIRAILRPQSESDEPTDEQIAAGMRELFAGPKPWPSWETTLKRVYQAMSALRPQAVPMTDEPTWIEWAPGDPNPTDSSRIEWVNSAGHTGCTTADKLCWHGDGLPVVRYRITASAGGEEK